MPKINTFVFFDLEATGLHGIGEKPRITEISLVAVHRFALLEASHAKSPPRVMDKVTLCVYPMKPISPNAADITGLHNNNLLEKKDFDRHLVLMVALFLDRQDAPVCMVAHNGLQFDYPLLQAELRALGLRLPEQTLCMDSLEMLRNLDEQEELEKQQDMRYTDQDKPVKHINIDTTNRPNFTSSMNAEIKGRVMSVKRKLSFDVDCSNPESKYKQAKINAKVVDITDCNYNKVAAQDIGAGDSTDREGSETSSSEASDCIILEKEIISQSPESPIFVPDTQLSSSQQSSSKSTVLCDLGEKSLTIPDSQEAGGCDSGEEKAGLYSQETEEYSAQSTPINISLSAGAAPETSARKSFTSTVNQLLPDLTCNEAISSSDSDPEHSKDTTGFPIAANSWGSYEDVTDAMLLSVDMGEALQQLIDEKSVTRLKDDVNIKTRNTNTGDNAFAEAERSADLMASDSEPFQCAQVPQVFTGGSSDESNTDGDFSQFSTLPSKLEKRIQYERQEEDIGNVETISSSDSDLEHSKDTTAFPIGANPRGSYEDVTDAMLLSVDMGEVRGQFIDGKSFTRPKDDVNTKIRNTNTDDNASAITAIEQFNNASMKTTAVKSSLINDPAKPPFPTTCIRAHTALTTGLHNASTSAKLHGHSAQQHPRKSFKLGDVHKRMLGWEATDSHTAEADCLSLVRIYQKLGNRALRWADEKAVLFSDIKTMYTVASRTPLRRGVFPYN